MALCFNMLACHVILHKIFDFPTFNNSPLTAQQDQQLKKQVDILFREQAGIILFSLHASYVYWTPKWYTWKDHAQYFKPSATMKSLPCHLPHYTVQENHNLQVSDSRKAIFQHQPTLIKYVFITFFFFFLHKSKTMCNRLNHIHKQMPWQVITHNENLVS